MFRETSPQRSIFSTEHLIDEPKRERLKQTWAHQYYLHALALIDESRFAKYFHDDNGRPNKSVRLVISLLIFKELFNLTDAEALEQLEWNIAWHHALDITSDEAHTCQKTMHNFRQMLLEDDEGAGLFEGITARIIKAAGLKTGRQRQDSTHILSNIRLLTRLGLFVQTITQFLEALRKEHPRLCSQLSEELRNRYLDREGYFSDARSSEAPRRLNQSALDLYSLVEYFLGHHSVSKMEKFKLILRLYEEQCEPPEEENPEKVQLKEKPSSSSLQSPSDPDVTYGHKGKGYEVQLVETCEKENEFQVITSVNVHGSNEGDRNQVAPALEQTERTCGQRPTELINDAGYASGENIVNARAEGTELVTPIGTKESEKYLPLADFEFDPAGERVIRCPEGHRPKRQYTTENGKTVALFQKSKCCRCPFKNMCPTNKQRKWRVLRFTSADVAVSWRRDEQQTIEFKERYKIRSGIEATNSELKRCHGLSKLRVRRRKRVSLSVHLKILGLNMKRYVANLANAVKNEEPALACA